MYWKKQVAKKWKTILNFYWLPVHKTSRRTHQIVVNIAEVVQRDTTVCKHLKSENDQCSSHIYYAENINGYTHVLHNMKNKIWHKLHQLLWKNFEMETVIMKNKIQTETLIMKIRRWYQWNDIPNSINAIFLSVYCNIFWFLFPTLQYVKLSPIYFHISLSVLDFSRFVAARVQRGW